MVLSSFVLALATHAFLVQNQLYSLQTVRVGVQDAARASTELVAREVRNVPRGGLVVAGRRTLTVRTPMALSTVCYRQGSPDADVFSEGGEDGLEVGAVAGVAMRNDSTWDYQSSTWAALDGGDGSSAANCAATGADTVGARGAFHRLLDLDNLFTGGAAEGDVIMIYRETTFTIATSLLEPTGLALFRADYGAAAVEFATGLDTTSHFEYRTSVGTYVDTVTAASLSAVDAVRIVVDSRGPAVTGGAQEVLFGWGVNVPLRTVRSEGN